jgi:23S rRNA pseudouridine1911/1915/1917 synthase
VDILEVWRWVAEESDQGIRLDHFLRDREPGPTRSQLKRLIESGLALVDGEPCRPAKRIAPGQCVELRIPPPEPLSAEPEPMDLDVRYEDEHLIVVDKPQGVVVHPAPGHPTGTLVNGLLYGRTTAGGDPLRPGIVHRLDKDTSGLLVVAKDERTHADLARQFQDHSIDRQYQALVVGSPPDEGVWSTLHGRSPRDRKLFSSRVTRGRRAVSRFEVIDRFDGAARLRVTLETGRTHQVRVHCADHGFPVLGDPRYGPRRLSAELRRIHASLPGQALHAERLGFDHPILRERLELSSDPPPAFQEALVSLQTIRAAGRS